ncbi:MAG: phosphate acyltransferase PlsX [Rhodospirillaceae bacterium]|nr:phosphate acyltransferase PlsX [Rhodospirillaceae bacterium]MBT4220496.1 phosphate acyltransferase PlsX [Rhodospirillaceae bacterium]MBT4464112.1 phosphate acyltransferase PlsX [Rhodospirillaceae bacterium]MBT5308039.1 phosphate acyltransferase PlsX [Rhodospirillaceae bacterium]MBT7355645.1 phosphate acyltransferase PlsX [Rhodospirillaceae bacterium]
MNTRLTLSVDAMGGDNAPEVVIEGIVLARDKLPQVDYLLYGNEQILKPLLDKHGTARKVCEIRHTDDVVSNDEKPGIALRSGRNSSMRLAINAVGQGEAAGVVSAGNTGALMAMAKFVLKTLPGIDRPAIASFFPTMRGESLMLDLGANVVCNSDNLVQFAVMGEVFARNVFHIKQPSIGILNIGSEELKGHDSVKQTFNILQNIDLPIRFHGFVEGDDIAKGTVDVIVTDGFTGNIALKTAEGTARMFGSFLKDALHSTPISMAGGLLAKPALNKLRMRLDPSRYNGAMFLGLNGICVKSHGGTDALGFSNALGVAAELVNDGLNDVIKEDLSHLDTEEPGANKTS